MFQLRPQFTTLTLMLGLLTLAQACLFGGKRDAAAEALQDEVDAGTGTGGTGTGGTGGDSGSIATVFTTTFSASVATLSGADLELQNSSSEISLASVTTGVVSSCSPGSFGANWGVTSDNMSTSRRFMGGPYTPTSSHAVSVVRAPLNRYGGTPSGSLVMKIYSNASSAPGTAFATSAPLLASSVANGVAEYDFSFATPASLTAGTTYWMILTGDTNYSFAGSSGKIQWYDSTSCSSAPWGTEIGSSDGASWNVLDFGYGVMVRLLAPQYSSSSPTATFVADAFLSANWDLASFTASENPNSESGTITYDVGATDDGVAVYAHSAKTKAEVQALGTLTGRYFHIRAAFGSDGNKDATLGTVTVNYTH